MELMGQQFEDGCKKKSWGKYLQSYFHSLSIRKKYSRQDKNFAPWLAKFGFTRAVNSVAFSKA